MQVDVPLAIVKTFKLDNPKCKETNEYNKLLNSELYQNISIRYANMPTEQITPMSILSDYWSGVPKKKFNSVKVGNVSEEFAGFITKNGLIDTPCIVGPGHIVGPEGLMISIGNFRSIRNQINNIHAKNSTHLFMSSRGDLPEESIVWGFLALEILKENGAAIIKLPNRLYSVTLSLMALYRMHFDDIFLLRAGDDHYLVGLGLLKKIPNDVILTMNMYIENMLSEYVNNNNTYPLISQNLEKLAEVLDELL